LLDAPLLDLLGTLNKSGELERTVIIVMTDHGAQFSAVRLTPEATIEEHLPFMSVILPSSFRQRYPHAINALRTNVNCFNTPFDVHAILLSLLNTTTITSSKSANVDQRNIALFHIVPTPRACDHIKLAPH
jgi:arylsulfatase A-like enzyme